ncbi:family 20 glycosylhydrolase [Ferruginibacter sp. HRS2-29]|uniref:family 20 glycosylhydrolase n=1 Tax=Ferruginibacter sp. HRS2-29 TaxID=2487334 RepID=UPI0020CEF288|nr:family 20 glycosylhydrolase [Ferruginibacter sp. HRS2-29]
MKKTIAAIFLLFFLVGENFCATAQVNNFNPADLSITFEAVANDFNNGGQALLLFTLKNNGKKILPATGWKIYFNSKSALRVKDTAAKVKIERQKANLFCLLPIAGSEAITPGKGLAAEMLLDDNLINKSDCPEGFYLVWDDRPLKGYDIKNVSVKPIKLKAIDGRVQSDYAAVIYHRNLQINRAVNGPLSKVFPTPVNYAEGQGSFILTGEAGIETDEAFAKEAAYLSVEAGKLLGKKLSVAPGNSGKKIRLVKKEGFTDEGYNLEVSQEGITIAAGRSAGIFYGIQSLKTLLPAASWSKSAASVPVPFVEVNDAPRFGYRGFMMDVARDFQTKEEVKRILDLMSLLKLNTFHFHITDDEGWRLEINGLPELTSFGSQRGHSLDEANHLPSAYGSGADTGKLYGSGFYSRKDFIEILQYANDRHIQVIPEIETPGHARAAIKAMDFRYRKYMAIGNREEALKYFLRDTLDASEYTTPQAFHDNVINVALPSCYTFIGKIIEEVDILYKEAGLQVKTIHFGGDEVPSGTWERSPACNALIAADPALDNTNDLWYYYLGKVNKLLSDKGIALSGWEEIGLRKTVTDGQNVMIPNPGFTAHDLRLYVWNNIGGNEDLAYKLANAGYKIVLTPVTNFYLDMVSYKTYDEPGYFWGGITDISKTYGFIPFDLTKNLKEDHEGNPVKPGAFAHKQRLTDYGKTNVLGIQAALWAETIKGPQQLEYMLLPRLLALAERAWQKDPAWANEKDSSSMRKGYNDAWSSFVSITGNSLLPMLDRYNGGYNYRIPPAGAIVSDNAVLANTQFPGFEIRYTVNGGDPTFKSNLYRAPITDKGLVRLRVFNREGRAGYTTVIENK